jgi:uncharacterized membrane protein YeaQ/YmgE (transglycosylase-associated protein family)
MPVSVGEILLWLIVGGLVGSLVGRLVKWRREGYGPIVNILLGVAGALVGGALFNLFKVDLGLGELKVTFEDLIAALFGSIVVLVVVWGVRTKKKLLFWISTVVVIALAVTLISWLTR